MSRPRKHPLPSIEQLRERFAYDPETGVISYRPKPELNGRNRRFNNEHAGKEITTTQSLGYIVVHTIDGRAIIGHRVAWAIHHGEWPSAEIDHIDLNKTNNRLANLRSATVAENRRNKPSRNSTGLKGVSVVGPRFGAKITFNGHQKWLGTFDTPRAAYDAYCRAAEKLHGEFANFDTISDGSINAANTLNINNAGNDPLDL